MIVPVPVVERALSRTLDRRVLVERRTELSGGSINRTELIETSVGSFVLKANPSPPAGFFRAEASGLEALRQARTGLTIPRVIAYNDAAPSFLVIEYLPAARRRPDFAEQLGRGLATLHHVTAARFGFAEDNYCGTTPQPNAWCERWVEFYGRSRLGHQLRLAATAGRLTTGEAGRIERLIERLGDWLGEPASGPGLIHGDLWSGNLHVDAHGQPALLDPAAYYGHREAEFGMMTLFGGFSGRVFDAYDEAFPLEAEWRERTPLYQLYHLMNHLNLFGSSYHGQVMAVVTRFV